MGRTLKINPGYINVLFALRTDKYRRRPTADQYLSYFVAQGWKIRSLALLSPTSNDEHLYSRFGAPVYYLPDSREMEISRMVGQIRNHFAWAQTVVFRSVRPALPAWWSERAEPIAKAERKSERWMREMANDRTPIPEEVSVDVLFLHDHTCCVCHEHGLSVQIHHIDDDPSNNAPENLAVLCLQDHDRTQLAGGFGRRLQATEVRRYRNDWLERVKIRREQADKIASERMARGQPAAQTTATWSRPPQAMLNAYIEHLPELLRAAYAKARPQWDTGVTAEMRRATSEVIARSRGRWSICSFVRIAQTCFCRNAGLAPVSFPLFHGIRLGTGSSELALSCMVVLLGYRGGRACLAVPRGAEIVSLSGNRWGNRPAGVSIAGDFGCCASG
jgi:5-methylcytosine-specific restriction endonuclease McrA